MEPLISIRRQTDWYNMMAKKIDTVRQEIKIMSSPLCRRGDDGLQVLDTPYPLDGYGVLVWQMPELSILQISSVKLQF